MPRVYATVQNAQRNQHCRNGIDSIRLEALVEARGTPQKHFWRARIVLLSDEGLDTVAIMAVTGKSKICVLRWHERFMPMGWRA